MTKAPRPRNLELLAIVSDIHAGSVVALMPPEFEVEHGQIVKANALQLWYWRCWFHAQSWLAGIAGKSKFGLIVNGDCIEGDHHRTHEIWSKLPSDHARCAVELLEPFVRMAHKTWFVQGTECHVGLTESHIARELGGEKNPETKRPIFQRLTLDICGQRLVAKHHISTTSRPWLESNALGAELASEQLNAMRNGERMPNIVCAAHRHVAGHVQTGDGLCLVTSAWQGLTTHGHKVVSASRSKPSIYVLDWRGIPDGELPRVHRRVYDTPPPAAIAT